MRRRYATCRCHVWGWHQRHGGSQRRAGRNRRPPTGAARPHAPNWGAAAPAPPGAGSARPPPSGPARQTRWHPRRGGCRTLEKGPQCLPWQRSRRSHALANSKPPPVAKQEGLLPQQVRQRAQLLSHQAQAVGVRVAGNALQGRMARQAFLKAAAARQGRAPAAAGSAAVRDFSNTRTCSQARTNMALRAMRDTTARTGAIMRKGPISSCRHRAQPCSNDVEGRCREVERTSNPHALAQYTIPTALCAPQLLPPAHLIRHPALVHNGRRQVGVAHAGQGNDGGPVPGARGVQQAPGRGARAAASGGRGSML